MVFVPTMREVDPRIPPSHQLQPLILSILHNHPTKGESMTLTLQELAERFCAAPLPASVCADPCATEPNYPYPRTGTNLLTVEEAKTVLAFVLNDTLSL